MRLTPGTRVGAFEIVISLGAGGMGEVYRARDTKLGRDVALKILPHLFASDPERLTRFEREAKTLATLNHPHIAQIYGIEDGPADAGVHNHALVMELVAGEDLSERIARGPIAVDEALMIARQIAEALEAAHEQGIVHRDLKPGNVKVRDDGTVKVLDFGLAKAVTGGAADLPNSPTMAGASAANTVAGMILGTAAYMSPEQARGKAVDKRSDIWAFGCVLFEMLSGRKPFDGETMTDLLAAVVKNDPEWSMLSPDVPVAVRTLLTRCLEKDPRQRLRDIGDALPDLQHDRVAATPIASDGMRSSSSLLMRVFGVAALVVIGAAVGWSIKPGGTTQVIGRLAHLDLMLPAGHDLFTLPGAPISLSPDGATLAFISVGGGVRRVFLRSMETGITTAVGFGATDAAVAAFFSPDGASLGLVTRDRTLQRMSLRDGLISSVGPRTGFSRPIWTANDQFVFSLKTLWRVPATGGEPTELSALDTARNEGAHTVSGSTADGSVLFTSWQANGMGARVEAVRPSGERVVIADQASSPELAPTGHLLFVRNGALLAAPFDATSLRVTGEAFQVLAPNVVRFTSGMPILAFSKDTLVYAPAQTGLAKLVRVSATGVAQPISETARHYGHPRVSPDGRRVVVENGVESLWIHDLDRDSRTPLTSGQLPGVSFPIWARDGRRIFYRRLDEIYSIDAGGSGEERAVRGTIVGDIPVSVAPDGDTLAILRANENTGGDVYVVSLSGAFPTRPLVRTPGYDGGAEFSPDGRLMAYASTDAGQSQVYLMPYPAADRKWSVSTRGGTQPRFSRSGQQIFYRNEDRLMVVDITTTGDDVKLSPPRQLFESRFAAGPLVTVANYDVTPDGGFIMMDAEPGHPHLRAVLNWTELLRRPSPAR